MYSDKQKKLLTYLVNKIGFLKDEFLENYLLELYYSSHQFRYVGAKPAIYEPEEFSPEGERMGREVSNMNYFSEYDHDKELVIPIRFSSLDFLNHEYRIKSNLLVNYKKYNSEIISATDISNFTFCSANFAILKTFELQKLESTFSGIKFHERKRLLDFKEENLINFSEPFKQNPEYINTKSESFIQDVSTSKILYSGHNLENNKKYFLSSKKNLIGQPDYILLNKDGLVYVIEEKFHLNKKKYSSDGSYYFEMSNNFYQNHVNQILSYIYGINDFEIQYGYLVYWNYSLIENRYYINSLNAKKIFKDDSSKKQIIYYFNNLSNFISKKTIYFDIKNRNPKKCANCISSPLCGHKTGKFDKLTFPYSDEYLKTNYAEFPSDLKNDNLSEKTEKHHYPRFMVVGLPMPSPPMPSSEQ